MNVKDAVAEAIHWEDTQTAQIETEIAKDLVVLADPELLVRALGNLVRNAVRYAGQAGPITISAAQEGGQITIAVADSGPGVPEGELAKIFDAFYRLDLSRTRETGGTGLGLTIVKTCVESCGGAVQARNRKPQGLEVVVRLGDGSKGRSGKNGKPGM